MENLDKNTQFSGFVETRNTEITIRWQKVQIFFLINSALLGITISIEFDSGFKFIASMSGLLVSTIWWLMQWEAQNAIDYWNSMVAQIEKTSESDIRGFYFACPREGFCFKYISTHHLILFLVDLFIIGWLGLAIFYLTS